jgi:hypothetical protein
MWVRGILTREASFKAGEEIRCMGETPQRKIKRLASEGDMRCNVFIGNHLLYYAISLAYSLASLASLYRTVFPRPFVAKRNPSPPKRTNTPHNADAQSRVAYAFACDSPSKWLIALLDALIIPPYMMLRSL